MNKDTKEKWVAALRGGKYKQCQGELKDASGAHCCLGVLLETQGWKETTSTTVSTNQDKFTFSNYVSQEGVINREENELDEYTSEAFGLNRQQQVRLMNLNDDKGWSFNLIARWIEDHL